MSVELDLKDYIRIIRKRIWLILSFVVVVSILAYVASTMWMTPIYQASTKLIVNKSNENVGISQLDLNTVNLNIRLIDTYKEIIRTPAIMNKVVQLYPELGLTSEQLTSKVSVSSVNNTQVMTLSVQDPSYAKASDIVNAISTVFITELPSIMQVDNVALLAAADPEILPSQVKPRPLLNTAIAFIVSLMVAVGAVFLIEYLDDTIRSEQDVEQYLGLPTIAMIPKVREDDMKRGRKQSASSQRRENSVQANT